MKRRSHFWVSNCSSKGKGKKQRRNQGMEYLYGTYMYGNFYFPMFGLEEPYLCIKVIFVGVSPILWLVLGFGWKFRVKRGKPAKIASKYWYSNLFLV